MASWHPSDLGPDLTRTRFGPTHKTRSRAAVRLAWRPCTRFVGSACRWLWMTGGKKTKTGLPVATFFFSTQLWPILISFFIYLSRTVHPVRAPTRSPYCVFYRTPAVHTITSVAHVVKTIPKHPGGVSMAHSSGVSASRFCAFTQLVNGSHRRTWVDPPVVRTVTSAAGVW